jgi:hypothetical protein
MRVAMAVLLTLLLVSCGSDASEPDAFGVRFTNDLGQPVHLALCNSDRSEKCEHPSYSELIPAAGSIEENIAPTVQTEWAVLDDQGRLRRCVLLYWHHAPRDEPTVRLAASPKWANPCPRHSN